MIRSTIEEVLFAPPEQVWQTVTETARYPAWRSDVSRVEAPGPGQWIEHTADGFSTACWYASRMAALRACRISLVVGQHKS